MTSRILSAASLLAILSACGGTSAGNNGVTVTPSPTPSATPAPSPSASPTATPAPVPAPSPTPTPTGSWAAQSAALFDAAPDVAACNAGKLKTSVRADVLARLNAIRALHGLPAVTAASADEGQATDAALMMAANGAISHFPPTTWKCYTAAGAAGAGSGNLYGGTISPYLRWYSDDDYLGGWMTEGGSAAIGHRRWMLDPYLGQIAYGRVSQVLADGSRTDAAVMKVFNFSATVATPTGLPAFVGYPQGDYPARYFDTGAYLSFSALAATRSAAANVRFTNAQVSVTGGGATLAVSDVASDNQGYGLPNVIQWKVAGLQAGVTYTVRITGVTGAPQADYTYTFRIVS